MTCSEFLARHSELLDAMIDAGAADRLRSHAAACPSCARYDRVVRRGGELVRDLPQVHVSDDFGPRIRHRLIHARERSARARSGSVPFLAAAASILFIAVGAGAAFTLTDPLELMHATSTPAAGATTSTASSAAHQEPSLTPLTAEIAGHDPHVVSPAAWPVYSRGTLAAAFPGPHTTVVVTPADFRWTAASRPAAGPLLVRH